MKSGKRIPITRLQAQDAKYLSVRRRRTNRRSRADEIPAPRDARRMRPYVYGDEREN